MVYPEGPTSGGFYFRYRLLLTYVWKVSVVWIGNVGTSGICIYTMYEGGNRILDKANYTVQQNVFDEFLPLTSFLFPDSRPELLHFHSVLTTVHSLLS